MPNDTTRKEDPTIKNTSRILLILTAFFLLISGTAGAHCEIPCGIYDDEARVKTMLEHLATIEKSMNEIMKIEKESQHNANQLVRWVGNKEHHADELQEIVAQYWLTQRIKPDAKDYDKKLQALHQLLLSAMKCKQTTDLANVEKGRQLVKEFESLYFAKE